MKRERIAWENILLVTHLTRVSSPGYRVQQKEGLLECGWWGNSMGVVTDSSNLNISPEMSYGVLECDIVMLQNYTLMIL